MLLFGESGSAEGGERTIRLTSRILVNPFTAKRLLLLLENAIRAYEARYGSIDAAAASVHAAIAENSAPPSDELKIRANFLLNLVAGLNAGYDFEPSFKMSPGKLTADRFLLVVDTRAIQEPHEKVLAICDRLAMPVAFRDELTKNLPLANPVDFGFEAEGGNFLYKVYLDFLPQLKKENGVVIPPPRPQVLLLGFKWHPEDPGKKALTKYTWFPSLSFETMLKKISEIFGHENERYVEVAGEVLEMISRRTGPDRVYYLKVTEEEGSRRSFDINAYSANLSLKELYPLLEKFCRHFSIPPDRFEERFRRMEGKTFGHFSGGLHRSGEEFLTVYFGLEPVRIGGCKREPV